MVADKSPRSTKADIDRFKDNVRLVALQFGISAASREFNVPRERIKKWAQRGNWRLSEFRGVHPLATIPAESPSVPNACDITQKVLQRHSEASRLCMAQAGSTAAEQFASIPGESFTQRDTAIAFEATSRAIDRTHGWSIAAQQAPTVNVAVQVNAPSAEERAELTALDRKLDAIAAKLKASE